ncbi:related to nitric-oxide synthase, salivary gland [Serendipita indica DSM 11827]|uniref:NADPH--hemoprotein reductase n=1 Tax=Serendipita indica (strain DSM 11827) TaxID=1109443 RepID=G4TU88_SERID|nr:related to nitric-oxide synthase, salivary gland [Serendipita indica DSM 11827]
MSCPATGQTFAGYGPRGCAFLGSLEASGSQTLYGSSPGTRGAEVALEKERKTICQVLLPTAPPKEITKNMANADSLNPSEADILAVALGAPARRVLERADALGPVTGWRDGWLSTKHGFCPPDPNAAPAALALSPGRVWSDICSRMPGLIARGRIREAILELPLIDGSEATIPDAALWAAVVCLGILASIWRYEERNDGHEGIVKGVRKEQLTNSHGEPDEEPETIGIPRNIVIPFRQVCTRLGRPLPYLSQSDVSLHNYKIRDPTSIYPYLPRAENMDLRWPIFKDRGEAMFLLCMAEVHGLFIPGPDLIARCQERVMEKDNDGLLVELIKLKEIIDQLSYVFHKISVNPHSGENFAPPASWGQGYAKFSAPLSKRVPALSGLFLPVFQCMDAFLMRTNFKSFLGIESIHLRAWMPLNIRAFLAAIENHYPVVPYIQKSGDPRLIGVLDAIVESYAGEKGFMGTHRYKVYGFLEIVAKTGRVETNGGAGSSDTVGRPWQTVHKTLADSMKERLEPYRGAESLDVQPQEMRGTYDECRFLAKIVKRTSIDDDPHRSTGQVTFDLENVGLTFIPGDRLAVMPLNSWSDVEKVVGALGLIDFLDVTVPLDAPTASKWKRYARHEADVKKLDSRFEPSLTVRDILRKGKLAPLTKETVVMIHSMVQVSSATLQVLGSETWPVVGSLGDLLMAALGDVPANVWDQAFPLDNLSWLPALIPPEVPRTYSISCFPFDLLPKSVDLTVTRAEHPVSPFLLFDGQPNSRPGVCSGFLNPDPTVDGSPRHPLTAGKESTETVLIGISRPLNFQLPVSPAAPVAMFAAGSGIAPFRGFWQARLNSGVIGRNILFLGVQSRKKFLYKHELRDHVQSGKLELHVAFSRDTAGLVYDPVSRDLVEKTMEPRYIDATIIDQGPTVCDLIISTKLGGLGGYLYICGSVSLYETVMRGFRKALYQFRAVTTEGADELLAQAFAERRCMLDVFMTPRVMSEKEPFIPLSELSRHTGHRQGSRMWIGVHGSVYDVTEFLPIHPGGTLIVAGSAGIDASVTFDEVAHTTNPEVMSLLGKYFIGYLTPKPAFRTRELNDLYDGWVDYLRTTVESLTTLSFEVDTLKKDSKLWFSDGLLSTHAIRKLYQLQSRFLTLTGFPVLFGTKLQELTLTLSFYVADHDQESLLPDIVGTITQAGSSPAAVAARKEVAELGEFVSNSATSAPAFQHGIIAYTRNICELDVRFIEQIREELCQGYDVFLRVAEVVQAYPSKEKQALYKLSVTLIGFLARIAERVESFYTEMAALSLYQPASEVNPARARWKFIQRRIKDGSFFILSREMSPFNLDNPTAHATAYESKRSKRQTVSFDHILSQAVSSMSKATPGTRNARRNESKSRPEPHPNQSYAQGISAGGTPPVPSRPLRLADTHTARAVASSNSTSFEDESIVKAANRMSRFMTGKIKDLRRLSKKFDNLSLEHAMARYGSPLQNEEDYSSESGSSASSLLETPRPIRDHQRSGTRHTAVEQLVGSQGSGDGVASRFRVQGSSGGSESGRTERSARTLMSRSDLQAATFTRKLSVLQSTAGSSGRSRDSPKPSHW